MNDDMDSEILFAASLGAVLSRMRSELDETAVKRVLTFALERYRITFSALYINTMPAAQLKANATVRETLPDTPTVNAAVPPPSTRIPIHCAVCPICGKTAVNERGLNTHMHMKHGTTAKEYRRTKALDEGGTP